MSRLLGTESAAPTPVTHASLAHPSARGGAAAALVASYGDRVFRLAIRITGNSSNAEEVVQDALWAVIRKIDGFRGTAAFGSWVYRRHAAYQKRRGRLVERNATSWDDLAPS